MPRDSLGRRAFLGRAAAGAGLAPFASGPTHAQQSSSDDGDDSMPASSIDDLARAVQSVITSKRIGTPVFVRLTVPGEEKEAAAIVERVAGLLDLVGGWLGQAALRVHATGNLEARQLSVTTLGANGGTAIVSFTGEKHHGDGIDLLLVGNQGSCYRDAGSGQLWDAFADPRVPGASTIRAIQQSLKSGKPVTIRPR